MVAVNFMSRFAPEVRAGTKLTTIRKERKRPFKRGDIIQLYTGQRTGTCKKLGEGRIVQVQAIRITIPRLYVSGCWLPNGSAERVAKADGFESYADMVEFIQRWHGLPFKGKLITWELIT